MRTQSRWRCHFLLLLSLLLLTACASTAPVPVPSTDVPAASGGVLRVATIGWPVTLHPQKASFTNDISLLLLNYEGLTRLDAHMNTVPGAAERWVYSPDATVVTFTLRQNLTYSDGSPLPAQAFVNAVYRTLDPRAPGDFQTDLAVIDGGQAIIDADPADESALETLFSELKVTAPDERTIVFQLTRSVPNFHTLVSSMYMAPARQDLIDAGGELWYEDPTKQIGNGPFQLSLIDQNSNLISYTPNPNYWQGQPKLAAIEVRVIDEGSVALRAYQNNEVDIAPRPDDVRAVRADPQLGPQLVEYPSNCNTTVELNLTLPPFDDLRVRQAFSYGFNRQGYIDDVRGFSQKLLTWIPPGMPGHDERENRFDYNPERGRALLAEAGYPEGQGLPEIRFAYASESTVSRSAVEYMAQMFRTSLGVTIVPDPIEEATLASMREDVNTMPQMVLGGWCGIADPEYWLSTYWHSRSGFAQTLGYTNPEVDALLDAADVETNPEQRMQRYAEAQRLIVGDAAQIIFANDVNLFLVKPSVKGYDRSPLDYVIPGETTGLLNVEVARE